MKKSTLLLFALFFFIILVGGFYTYRLTQDPPGLTVDEASIGYNAVLISKTLKDETGRFLPVFALTIGGHDWKQPSSIYAAALIFKLFGASLFNLRMVSVMAALFSFILVVYLNYLLLGYSGAWISGFLFLSVPTVLMHSHLAQENIMPIPFVTIWLISFLLYQKKKNPLFLIVSGIGLGLGIYSYKGMRAIVPPLALISFIFLFFNRNWRTIVISILSFGLGLAPFILIMPWLNTHYAGALFDHQGFSLLKYYDFLYPYLSSFDVSALFIRGDITPWHSTGFHGMFLVSTLPLYLLGLVAAFRQKDDAGYWRFLVVGFFLSPLLFGQVGSVYRFSRLLVFVPFFVTFCTLGLLTLLKIKRGFLITSLLSVLILLNFFDFVKYYWFTYPVFNRGAYGLNLEMYYKKLADLSKEKRLEPYIFTDDYNSSGEDAHFFEAAYFNQKIKQWKPSGQLPPHSLLMTRLAKQPGLTLLEADGPFFYLIKE